MKFKSVSFDIKIFILSLLFNIIYIIRMYKYWNMRITGLPYLKYAKKSRYKSGFSIDEKDYLSAG